MFWREVRFDGRGDAHMAGGNFKIKALPKEDFASVVLDHSVLMNCDTPANHFNNYFITHLVNELSEMWIKAHYSSLHSESLNQ